MGKDLGLLQERLRGDTRAAIAAAAVGVERRGLDAFPEQPVPRTVAAAVGGVDVIGYPALVDEGATVGVRVFTTEAEQQHAGRRGMRRLLLRTLRSPGSYLRHALPRDVMLIMVADRRHGGFDGLVADATGAAIDALLDWAGGIAWTAAGFEKIRTRVAGQLDRATQDIVLAAADVLRTAQRIDARWVEFRTPAVQASIADARAQLAGLLPADFISRTGAGRLPDLERYLQALTVRLDRLAADPERDRQRMAEIDPWVRRFARVREELPDHRRDDASVRQTAVLLDEWRVSLFAQPMRTAVPVSRQRVEKAILAMG